MPQCETAARRKGFVISPLLILYQMRLYAHYKFTLLTNSHYVVSEKTTNDTNNNNNNNIQ